MGEGEMASDQNDGTDNASDIEFVKALAQVLRENDLGELEVERSSSEDVTLSVRISKSAPAAAMATQVAPAPVAVSAAAPAPSTAPTTAPAPVASDDPADLAGAITSPMVGTAYLAPEPGAANFVKIGDQVSEGQTLVIVEAMKTMNQIPSPKSGTVKRILIDDGSPVEYGAPLMVVE